MNKAPYLLLFATQPSRTSRPSRSKYVALIVALAVALSACSGDDEAGSTTAPPVPMTSPDFIDPTQTAAPNGTVPADGGRFGDNPSNVTTPDSTEPDSRFGDDPADGESSDEGVERTTTTTRPRATTTTTRPRATTTTTRPRVTTTTTTTPPTTTTTTTTTPPTTTTTTTTTTTRPTTTTAPPKFPDRSDYRTAAAWAENIARNIRTYKRSDVVNVFSDSRNSDINAAEFNAVRDAAKAKSGATVVFPYQGQGDKIVAMLVYYNSGTVATATETWHMEGRTPVMG